MNVLYLLRHSLTRANEHRLYCGWTDLPLSPAGRDLALRACRSLPVCDTYVTSGLFRANQTLELLTGQSPGIILPDLREMNFGRFEMQSHEQLKDDADYQRWIEDATGAIPCPGGESRAQFARRVRHGGAALLNLPGNTALAVLHGGVIVRLMEAWFPDACRGFYDWQPEPCRGYRVTLRGGKPAEFAES